MIITKYSKFFEQYNNPNNKIIDFLNEKGIDLYQYALDSDIYLSIKTNNAIKINYSGSSIKNIDIWNEFSFDKSPNKKVEYDNLNKLYFDIVGKSEEFNSNLDSDINLNNQIEKDVKITVDNFLDSDFYKGFDVFQQIEKFTYQVGSGQSNSLLITGQAGIGKTYVVEQTLEKKLNLKPDYGYYSITGQITTAGLYETLFRFRHNDKLILFDDIDSVFKSDDSVNMLKGALDTSRKRQIAKVTSGNTFDSIGMTDDEIQEVYNDTGKLPKKFEYEGRIIFISNIAGEKFDKALLTRSLWVDVNLTNEEIMDRMIQILPYVEVSEGTYNKKEILKFKKEAFDFLTNLIKNNNLKFDLNLRTLIHICNIRIANQEFIVDIKGNTEFVWKLLARKYLIKTI